MVVGFKISGVDEWFWVMAVNKREIVGDMIVDRDWIQISFGEVGVGQRWEKNGKF